MIWRVAGTVLAVLLWSCGLETYQSLDAPVLTVTYQQQSDYTRLSLTHDPGTYGGSDFLGYEVYYKIYPDQLNATTNLARDAGVVSTTPKIETLTSLGYKRLSSATLIHPLLPMDLNTTSKQTVVLDFSAFLASLKFATGTVDEPTASIVSATGTKLTEIVLVRSLSTPNEVRISANFSDLANAVTLIPDSDMDSASVTTATKSFEIEFFIVAYAESRETFVQYYSTPVPWGIISGIMVRS